MTVLKMETKKTRKTQHFSASSSGERKGSKKDLALPEKVGVGSRVARKEKNSDCVTISSYYYAFSSPELLVLLGRQGLVLKEQVTLEQMI